MIQEANAASRKATGKHNRADRAEWPGRKAADVDQVCHPKYGVTTQIEGEVRCTRKGRQTDPRDRPIGIP
jgi:hypothetical protein